MIDKKEMTYTDYALKGVPYYSQYLDMTDRLNQHKACGMTCVKMALEYYKKETPSLDNMFIQGVEQGGYTEAGWLHDYFVQLFQNHELKSIRKERLNDSESIVSIIDSIDKGSPIIASTESRFLEDRNFHMILIVGYRKDSLGKVVGFFYHDPAKLYRDKGQYQYVSVATFLIYSRRMFIYTHLP